MPDDNISDDGNEPTITPTYPKTVKAAGYVWVAFGLLILLISLVGVAVQSVKEEDKDGKNPVGGMCPLICPMLFGAVFLHAGMQSLSGEAKDTLGNSIGSIIFSLIYGGLNVALFAGGLNVGRLDPMFMTVAGIMAATGSLGLLSAGVMALMGRTQYKAWKKDQRAKNSKTKKRKKADRDEEEEA